LFAADVLQQTPNAELGTVGASAGLRRVLGTEQGTQLRLPLDGWRLVRDRADTSTFVAPDSSSWAFVTLTYTGAGWEFYEGGRCALRMALPDGVGVATWRLDPAKPPDPSATTVTVLGTEMACASGKPPTGRLLPPIVITSPDAVSITLLVRNRPGGQDCQGNPEVRVVVHLDEALGSRRLIDGSWIPVAGASWTSRRL
jgi:hypothetical protein